MPLSQALNDALNAEIGLEFAAHHQYLAIGVYFAGLSLDNLASFFFDQAEEEKMHGLKLLHYIVEVDGTVQIPAVPAPQSEFEAALEAADLFVRQEEMVTQKFYEMAKLAEEDGDYITRGFLDWFITEQREEMATSKKLFDWIRMSGDNLMLVDLRIPELEAASAEAEAEAE
ncbi:MAG: ferritin [Chloroflexi bacterium]|nr:ferritin [Chloroflexota bacterium]